MAERRHTLAVASAVNLSEESQQAWLRGLNDQGFNTLDASYRHTWTHEGMRSHIEASLGFVVLNREIVTGDDPYHVHWLHEARSGIRIAHEFGLPVYLTSDPSVKSEFSLNGEFSAAVIQSLHPYELIRGEDLSIVRQRFFTE